MAKTRKLRRFVLALAAIAAVLCLWLALELREPWPAEQGVHVVARRGGLHVSHRGRLRGLIDGARVQATSLTRDVHAKAHGCVKARFDVGELDPRLPPRTSSRAPGRTTPGCASRAATLAVQSDGVHDARGFALKVMGVPGEKLLPAEKDAATQDFVMINSRASSSAPCPSTRSSRPSWREAAATASSSAAPPGSPGAGTCASCTWPEDAQASARQPAADAQYHSLSAYRLGPEPDRQVLGAKPCECPQAAARRQRATTACATRSGRLAAGDGCFDLLVQLQVAGKNMPVEDSTVEWPRRTLRS